MRVLLFGMLMLFCQAIMAQPELPAMALTTEKATNVLRWTNQFDGVKSMVVQRSADSVRNFVTIGIITPPKKGALSFTDDRPLPGKNHYRILTTFAGDVDWFSNTYMAYIDSATLAKSLAAAIETGSTKAKPPTEKTTTSDKTSPPATSKDFYYTPSTRIYTNPYTGHININLDDSRARRYSIRFLDPEKNEVLRVSRVTKTFLVLDKNNFNAKGIYQFQLYDGTSLVESGYITIY